MFFLCRTILANLYEANVRLYSVVQAEKEGIVGCSCEWFLERQDTRFRELISVEARVGITIWRLAKNVEYRIIAALFGVGEINSR